MTHTGAEPREGSVPSALVVTFGGTRCVGGPGKEITFGRGSGVTIRVGPEDLHVHRRVGAFRWAPGSGLWELHNDGSATTLEVRLDGGLEARIAVGAHPLVLPADAQGSVRVLTPTPYVITFVTPGTAIGSGPGGYVPDDVLDTPTVDPKRGLGLSDDEFRMLVALCEPRLRDPSLPAFTVPSTKDVCGRLGITPKRAEDLVDALVVTLAPHVDGVIGSNDGRAVNRRHRIAAFAIDTRCVTARDLRQLDTP